MKEIWIVIKNINLIINVMNVINVIITSYGNELSGSVLQGIEASRSKVVAIRKKTYLKFDRGFPWSLHTYPTNEREFQPLVRRRHVERRRPLTSAVNI